MHIFLASDHAGITLKSELHDWLSKEGLAQAITDLGAHDDVSVDYPDYAAAAAKAMKAQPDALSILICGSGIGISIAANRHSHVRAALVTSDEAASLSRQHNNANTICLGARFTNDAQAKTYVKTFLTTPFEGGRHTRRVEKLSNL